MAKLTWLGTDGTEQGDEYIPLSPCTWCGVTFEVGQPVEVTDETMIRKARGNRFFRVEDNGKGKGPVPGPFGPMPETWTNDPPPPPIEEPPRYPTNPPDYPPEDEPDREPNKKRRGRPPRIRDNGDGE